MGLGYEELSRGSVAAVFGVIKVGYACLEEDLVQVQVVAVVVGHVLVVGLVKPAFDVGVGVVRVRDRMLSEEARQRLALMS
jgi:hypothetical protein